MGGFQPMLTVLGITSCPWSPARVLSLARISYMRLGWTAGRRAAPPSAHHMSAGRHYCKCWQPTNTKTSDCGCQHACTSGVDIAPCDVTSKPVELMNCSMTVTLVMLFDAAFVIVSMASNPLPTRTTSYKWQDALFWICC